MTRPTALAKAIAFAGTGLFSGLALPAQAEDYPYSGQFWPAGQTVDPADVERLCALTFLDQRSDGTWSVYHVDLAAFRATKAIVYRKLSEGACHFTPATKVEACLVTMDKSYPEGEGVTFYDVITAAAQDRINTVMIEAASGWETLAQDAEAGNSGIVMDYLRCPFPSEALISRIGPDTTTLTADDLNDLRIPSEDLLASPDLTLLVQMLRGG